MKVLKKGRKQLGASKEYTCTGGGNGGGGCGARLLVSEYDMYYTHSYHYDGSSESYVTFECPDCHVQTDAASSSDRPPVRYGSRDAWRKAQKGAVRELAVLTVDCLVTIRGSKVLLIERTDDLAKGKLFLPGGHFEKRDGRLATACSRELEEEVGLKIAPEELRLVTVLDAPDRDPRKERRISLVYHVDLSEEPAIALSAREAKRAIWREIATLAPEEVGLDHYEAIASL